MKNEEGNTILLYKIAFQGRTESESTRKAEKTNTLLVFKSTVGINNIKLPMSKTRNKEISFRVVIYHSVELPPRFPITYINIIRNEI